MGDTRFVTNCRGPRGRTPRAVGRGDSEHEGGSFVQQHDKNGSAPAQHDEDPSTAPSPPPPPPARHPPGRAALRRSGCVTQPKTMTMAGERRSATVMKSSLSIMNSVDDEVPSPSNDGSSNSDEYGDGGGADDKGRDEDGTAACASDDDVDGEDPNGGGANTLPNDDDNEGDDNKVSPYELLRRAKIARNEAVLRELGLMNPNVTSLRAPTTAHRRRDRRPKKRGWSKIDDDDEDTTHDGPYKSTPPRRSTRLRSKSEASGSTSEPLDRPRFPRRAHRPTLIPRSWEPGQGTVPQAPQLRVGGVDVPYTVDTPPNSSANILSIQVSPAVRNLPSNTARAISLDVDRLVSTLLGQTLEETGKAHVMMESAKIASSVGHMHTHISFNKYSGVQEWADSSSFLWINLGNPVSDVVNEFQRRGRLINWFGGSRMYPDSSSTQNLVAAGTLRRKRVDDDGNDDAEPELEDPCNQGGGVVLWCRRHDPDRNAFEPYTCLGRLQLVSWDAHSHPIEFLWELRDYDRLWDHPDDAARVHFRSLVQDYSRSDEK